MRFLLVEDDDYKARHVEDELKGHEVVRAKAINPGLRELFDGAFEGVILDMGLPRWDTGETYEADMGLQFLAEMKRKRLKTPVLVCSGNKFDVSEYDHVLGYIVFNSSVSIQRPMAEFVEKVSTLVL